MLYVISSWEPQEARIIILILQTRRLRLREVESVAQVPHRKSLVELGFEHGCLMPKPVKPWTVRIWVEKGHPDASGRSLWGDSWDQGVVIEYRLQRRDWGGKEFRHFIWPRTEGEGFLENCLQAQAKCKGPGKIWTWPWERSWHCLSRWSAVASPALLECVPLGVASWDRGAWNSQGPWGLSILGPTKPKLPESGSSLLAISIWEGSLAPQAAQNQLFCHAG